MALSADVHYAISSVEGGSPIIVERAHPQLTNTVIYQGAILGLVAGNIRPLDGTVAGTTFAGIAARKSDSTGIATGVKRPDVIQEGFIKCEINATGWPAGLIPGTEVFSTADDNFIIDDVAIANSVRIGKIHTVIGADGLPGNTANTCIVFFQANQLRVA